MLRYFIVMRGDSLSLSNLVECWKQIQMNVDIPLISSCLLSTHNNFHMDIPQPWNPSGVWRNGINRKNVKTKGAWSQEMKVMTQWTRVSEQYIIHSPGEINRVWGSSQISQLPPPPSILNHHQKILYFSLIKILPFTVLQNEDHLGLI